MEDERKTLAEYIDVVEGKGVALHAVDNDPNSILKQLANDTDVVKYEISREKYLARPDTAHAFLQRLRNQGAGNFDTAEEETEAGSVPVAEAACNAAVDVRVGERVQVGGSKLFRGAVAFCGNVSAPTRKTQRLPAFSDAEPIIGIRLDHRVGTFGGFDGATQLFDAMVVETDARTHGMLAPLSCCEFGDVYKKLDESEIYDDEEEL